MLNDVYWLDRSQWLEQYIDPAMLAFAEDPDALLSQIGAIFAQQIDRVVQRLGWAAHAVRRDDTEDRLRATIYEAPTFSEIREVMNDEQDMRPLMFRGTRARGMVRDGALLVKLLA